MKQLPLFPDVTERNNMPVVVSYGGGTDSTAMLIEMKNRGIIPDAIVFADVGNEHEYTYDYLPVMQKWLENNNMPAITIVRYTPKRFKWRPYTTLGGNCIANRTLPSLAFGRKSCSLKWKVAPMDKWVSHKYGRNTPVFRAIGYDCSPKDSRRFAHAQGAINPNRPNDVFIYPLQDYGMNRSDCIDAINNAGLPQPDKSSCFFCPAKKAMELHLTSKRQLQQIVAIEGAAMPNLKTVRGLWRRSSMTDYIINEKLLPTEDVERILEYWQKQTQTIGTDSADNILNNKTTQ